MHFQIVPILSVLTGVTLACSGSRPAIKDASTVTVKLYDSSENAIQTISMGVLAECHDASAPFVTLDQAVGDNMFGRNIVCRLSSPPPSPPHTPHFFITNALV